MSNRQLEHTDHIASQHTFPLTLLADNIASANNIGSLFRLCDALGVEQLLLSGDCPFPPNRKINKTSRSTENHVAYACVKDLQPMLETLTSAGYTFISLELSSQSVDLRSLDYRRFEKICLILGAEDRGVSQSLLDISDHTIHIPMLGHNSSMNVVTAAAIALYEIIGHMSPIEIE